MHAVWLLSRWGPVSGQTPAVGHGAEDLAPPNSRGSRQEAGRVRGSSRQDLVSSTKSEAKGPSGRLPVPRIARATSRALDLEPKAGEEVPRERLPLSGSRLEDFHFCCYTWSGPISKNNGNNGSNTSRLGSWLPCSRCRAPARICLSSSSPRLRPGGFCQVPPVSEEWALSG